jgi:hypothetical protein
MSEGIRQREVCEWKARKLLDYFLVLVFKFFAQLKVYLAILNDIVLYWTLFLSHFGVSS